MEVSVELDDQSPWPVASQEQRVSQPLRDQVNVDLQSLSQGGD